MRGIARRIVSLEDRRLAQSGSFGHLTDEPLNGVAMRPVEQIERTGVELPSDSRVRYAAAPASCITWVAGRAEELAACVD